MTVEMNPPSACSIRSGSVKISNMGAQGFEDIERRLSDDIYSLSSWSENLSLSTSSSSDSVSYHGGSSSSRHVGQLRDVRSKSKPSIGKTLSAVRTQKKKAPNLSNTGFKVLSKEMESTSGSVDLPIPILSDYENEYQYEYQREAASINDPNISVFNTYGQYDTVDGSRIQRSKPSIMSTDETLSNNIDKVKATHVISNHKPDKETRLQLHPSTLQVQRLYPDLEALKHLDSQGNVLAVPSSLSPTQTTEVNSGSRRRQLQTQSQRRSFFDFQKLPNHHSRNLQAQKDASNSEGYNGTLQFLPTTSHLSHYSSDNSRQNFEKYNSKDEIVSNQSTGLAGRLHKSQPSIASAPQLTSQHKSSNDLESLRLSFEHRLEPENVKTKVKSVWNNIKYGWTFKGKPTFKCDSPLFILGKCYYRQKDDSSSDIEDQFLKDFISRIWFTYRSNFYPIPGTKLSTDCGWGCMIRTGQMLIAQCLVTHFLGRDWRLYNKQTETDAVYYREIIRWFSDPIDTPSDKTPFCLHHLANFGRTYNKDPGEWYGPASVAYIFRDAFTKASHTVPILSQLCIYVAQDCTVYIDDVLKMCTEKQITESVSGASEPDAGIGSSCTEIWNENWQRSLIILIPIRLGGEIMNEIYIKCVQDLLCQNNCMGIIGGKPKHSLYFIGWQDDKLIYLDPHLCRDAVDTRVADFRIETYHCMTPRKLSINRMDPSCTVGFYIRDGDDFKKFVRQVREFISPPNQKGAYPLFIFADGHLSESSAKHNQSTVDRRVRVTHYHVDQNGQRHRTFSENSEEFVML